MLICFVSSKLLFLIGVADKHMEYSFSAFSFWKHYAAPTARYTLQLSNLALQVCNVLCTFHPEYNTNDGIWRYFNAMKFFIDT